MAFVIKVDYDGTLRRLTFANQADLSFEKVETRIRNCFQLPATAVLKITYSDKDDDVVTVANDGDLEDACVTQALNPLRVRVILISSGGAQGSTPEVDAQRNKAPAAENAISRLVQAYEPLFKAMVPASEIAGLMDEIAKMVMTQQAPAVAVEGLESNPTAASDTSPAADSSSQDNDTIHEKTAKNMSQDSRQHTDNAPKPGPVNHVGVTCDVCGMTPIVGLRYKAVKKFDYDLCASCFGKEGNENEFYRIEVPLLRSPGIDTLMRMHMATAMEQHCRGGRPVLVFRPGGNRCNQMRSC